MPLPRTPQQAALARLVLAGAACCAFLTLTPTPVRADWVGRASWYGTESGRVTASGEPFRPGGMTAAHPTLPLGTRVRVTDLATSRSVVVTINDRGPHPRLRRLIDLSAGAARALGISARGVATVRVERLG